MRVMLDTNVLISALLFPNGRITTIVNCIFGRFRLVLSSYVINELKEVIQRKFPSKITDIEIALSNMSFEYVYTPSEIDTSIFSIRDIKDYPVLYTAIISNVDILITGDKDFLDVDVDSPVIMTPGEFFEKFCCDHSS